MNKWKLHVKNGENWKVFAGCKVLNYTCEIYKEAKDALILERKKDENQDDQSSKAIGLEIKCENLQTRI